MANLLRQTKDEINSNQKRAEALKKDCKRLVVQLNTLSQQLQYPTKEDVLTSNERKLILFLTAQAIQQKRLTPYVVKISDLPKIMGIKLSGGTYRKRLIKTLENLAYKKFNIVHQPHTTMLWIQLPIFHPKEHTVELRLHNDLKPFIDVGPKDPRTIFRYNEIICLQKKHSVDLYLLLCSAAELGKWKESAKNFSALIGGAYSRFSDIEEYVLAPSVEEINQKTNIFVTYKLVTKKRKVTAIEFEIKDNRREKIARTRKKKKQAKRQNVLDDNMIKKGRRYTSNPR